MDERAKRMAGRSLEKAERQVRARDTNMPSLSADDLRDERALLARIKAKATGEGQ